MSRSFRLGIFAADATGWRPELGIVVDLLDWIRLRFPGAPLGGKLWHPSGRLDPADDAPLQEMIQVVRTLPQDTVAEEGLSLSVRLRGERKDDHTFCDLVDERTRFCVWDVGMLLESSVRDTFWGVGVGAEATCPRCAQAVRFSVEDLEESELAHRDVACAACGERSPAAQYGYRGAPCSVFEIHLASLYVYDPPGLPPRLREGDLHELERVATVSLDQTLYYHV